MIAPLFRFRVPYLVVIGGIDFYIGGFIRPCVAHFNDGKQGLLHKVGFHGAVVGERSGIGRRHGHLRIMIDVPAVKDIVRVSAGAERVGRRYGLGVGLTDIQLSAADIYRIAAVDRLRKCYRDITVQRGQTEVAQSRRGGIAARIRTRTRSRIRRRGQFDEDRAVWIKGIAERGGLCLRLSVDGQRSMIRNRIGKRQKAFFRALIGNDQSRGCLA